MTAQAAPETLSPEQMEQAQGRLQSILSAAEKASNTPVPEPPKPGIVRKPLSDKGVPRESFYVSIPGVRFDMKEHEGFVAFGLWLDAQTEPLGHPTSLAIGEIIRQLLSEIDRLRAK